MYHLHVYKRNTGDIDLWIKDSLGNRQAAIGNFDDVLIPFLHINQLLYSKRPKDQVDVLVLDKIVK